MKIMTIQQDFNHYENLSELTELDRHLVLKAEAFLELSYAPYSHFNVAAALLLENGEIISGANQENASYPLCLCAERVALHHAAMRYPKVPVQLMAITARNKSRSLMGPIPPCGACRQVIAEYEKLLKKPIRLLLKGTSAEVIEFKSVQAILPLAFNGDYLQ